jgi:hypothetical protein
MKADEMKEQIVELFRLAGYDYIGENPGGKLLFYDAEMEQDAQFWMKGSEMDLQDTMEFIKERCYDIGKSIGRNEVQSGIKKLLGL